MRISLEQFKSTIDKFLNEDGGGNKREKTFINGFAWYLDRENKNVYEKETGGEAINIYSKSFTKNEREQIQRYLDNSKITENKKTLMKENAKVYVRGDAFTPARFWDYALQTDERDENVAKKYEEWGFKLDEDNTVIYNSMSEHDQKTKTRFKYIDLINQIKRT
jgi:hypothetical protein